MSDSLTRKDEKTSNNVLRRSALFSVAAVASFAGLVAFAPATSALPE